MSRRTGLRSASRRAEEESLNMSENISDDVTKRKKKNSRKTRSSDNEDNGLLDTESKPTTSSNNQNDIIMEEINTDTVKFVNSSTIKVKSQSDGQDWRKDTHNIALLMFLYLLQGVPLGLTGSLPYILSSRSVSYADQGTFSFAFWPFSLKLLWAPIVDSIYFKKLGRRKSWLAPVQYLIGIFLLSFANYTRELIEGKHTIEGEPNNGLLIFIFFILIVPSFFFN
jgi:hypothetical protein